MSGDCGCDNPEGPPEQVVGHPNDHSHPDDATFLYHDYYVRTTEGETAELCATLNRPVDTEVEVFYRTYDLSAEEEGKNFPHATIIVTMHNSKL